ncbi:hypothetical protein [Pedobacter sp.]|uniref:hypothetical protein n=1 Tax=Pedobacter sp. TaxID=1411316 RepID=UPI003BA96D0B
MKITQLLFLGCATVFLSCSRQTEDSSTKIKGSWQLLSATTNDKGKLTVTDFTKDQRMIKIINDTHFSFLRHNLSAQAVAAERFDAGGGRYNVKGDEYTEFLDFFKDKNWEGKTFVFKVHFDGDTLIQTGVEKVPEAGVDRIITEKYLRIKGE